LKEVGIVLTLEDDSAKELYKSTVDLIENNNVNGSISMWDSEDGILYNYDSDDEPCCCHDCIEDEEPDICLGYTFADVLNFLQHDVGNEYKFSCSSFESEHDYIYLDADSYDAPVLLKYTSETDSIVPYIPSYEDMLDYLWWYVE